MSLSPLQNFDRCCLHTMTTKPWSLSQAVAKYAAAGIKGITVWRQWLDGWELPAARRAITDAGLVAVSVARGGFFPARTAQARRQAIDDTRRAVDEAAAIGAPLVVLVCGADPGQPLVESRRQIEDAISALLPHAQASGVTLAVEPLHPMYANDRSAINTLKQANDLCDRLAHPSLAGAVDVYHLWWDPDLREQILRCGRSGYLSAFHVCDWRTPTVDFLNDRGLMGEGCIPIREIRSWVEEAGFGGFIEVEIFSTRLWQLDQDEFLRKIKDAYLRYV